MLDTNKVMLFVKSVDLLDCKMVGLLLEVDKGLTTHRVAVKRVSGTRHNWNDAGPSTTGLAAGKKREEPIPTWSEGMRQ